VDREESGKWYMDCTCIVQCSDICAQFHVDWDVQRKCAWIHAYAQIYTSRYFCGYLGMRVRHVSVGNPFKSLYMRPLECTFEEGEWERLCISCHYISFNSHNTILFI